MKNEVINSLSKRKIKERIKALQEEQKKDYSEYREKNIIQLKEEYMK